MVDEVHKTSNNETPDDKKDGEMSIEELFVSESNDYVPPVQRNPIPEDEDYDDTYATDDLSDLFGSLDGDKDNSVSAQNTAPEAEPVQENDVERELRSILGGSEEPSKSPSDPSLELRDALWKPQAGETNTAPTDYDAQNSSDNDLLSSLSELGINGGDEAVEPTSERKDVAPVQNNTSEEKEVTNYDYLYGLMSVDKSGEKIKDNSVVNAPEPAKNSLDRNDSKRELNSLCEHVETPSGNNGSNNNSNNSPAQNTPNKRKTGYWGAIALTGAIVAGGALVSYFQHQRNNALKAKVEATFAQDFRTLYGEKKLFALIDAGFVLNEVKGLSGVNVTAYQSTLDDLLKVAQSELDNEQKFKTQLDAKQWYGSKQTIDVLASLWGKNIPGYDEFVQSRRDLREAAQYFADYEANKNWQEKKEQNLSNLRNATRLANNAINSSVTGGHYNGGAGLHRQSLIKYQAEEDRVDLEALEQKLTDVYTGLDTDLFGNKLNLDEEAAKATNYLVEVRGGREFSGVNSKALLDLTAKLISERASQTNPTSRQRYIKTMHNTFGLPFKAGYHVGKAVKGLIGALVSPFSSNVQAGEELSDVGEGLVGTLRTATDLAGTAKTPLTILGQTSVGGVQIGKPLEVIDQNTPFQSPWSDKNFYYDTHTGYFPVPWKLLDKDVRQQLYEQQGRWVYLGVPVQLITDGLIVNSLVKHYEGGKETGRNNAGNNNGQQPNPEPTPTPSPTPNPSPTPSPTPSPSPTPTPTPSPTPSPTPVPTPGGIGGSLGDWYNGVNSK